VNAANSDAARRFWLYNRRFDGRGSDTMLGFKPETRPENKAKKKTNIK